MHKPTNEPWSKTKKQVDLTYCTVFFLVKQFLPMHAGADDIIENLLAKLHI